MGTRRPRTLAGRSDHPGRVGLTCRGADARVHRLSRLKDVTTLQGAATQPLIGYGLVVGLNKTGDRRQTIFSAQTLANMLERFGVAVSRLAGSRLKTSRQSW